MAQRRPRFSFWAFLKAPQNDLVLVLKSHHSIEAKLHRTLAELLPSAGKIELRRIGFMTKIDLLIAFGVLRSETRNLYEIANGVRNRYAHNPYAEFTEEDSKRAKNAIRRLDKSYSLDDGAMGVLASLYHMAFGYAGACHESVLRDMVRREVLAERSRAFLKRTESYKANDEASEKREADFQGDVERNLAARRNTPL